MLIAKHLQNRKNLINVRCKICNCTFKCRPDKMQSYCSNICKIKSKVWRPPKGINLGIKNNQWKENVGYDALHQWIRRHKPVPQCCENCGEKKNRLDCANISGKYKRDILDYKYICRRCHMIEDKRMNNLKYYKNGEEI
jgi:hypothetical protein